jgi:hypothetical protein
MQTDALLTAGSSLAALLISIVALVYTVRTYLLKAGLKLRCSYSIGWMREAADVYVRSLTIENLKDKAIVVFKIYLRIGANNFLEIDDFEKDPLILKPFEVFQKLYDPVVYYDVAAYKMRIDELFRNRKVRKAVVLSTSTGRHEITDSIRSWDAMSAYFKNYLTVVIRPMRLFHRGVAYGTNVKYLIDISRKDDTHEVVAVQDDDYMVKKFERFQLTRESLSSSNALSSFFEAQRHTGNVAYESIRVIDFQEELSAGYNYQNLKTIEVEQYGWLKYRLIGPFLTRRENAKKARAKARSNTGTT